MLFNSLTYIAFLATLYVIYRCVSYRVQNVVLLIGSYVFYAWWDVRFLLLLISATLVTYCCGLMIERGRIKAGESLTGMMWAIGGAICVGIIQHGEISRIFPQAFIVGTRSITTDVEWIAIGIGCLMIIGSNLIYRREGGSVGKRGRLFFLVMGVCANLLMLFFFKYYNFFIDNLLISARGLGLNPGTLHLDIVLPVGISFYSFKNISYLVDIYRGDIEAASRYLNFGLFVAFFPALLAGPIDRGGKLLSQLANKRAITWTQSLRGLHLILFGLFKKMVIADGVIGTVNYVFESKGVLTWMDVVMGMVFFTIQIYCDFSGYTDIARGTAKLFGIDLMINFRTPYFSNNPREFWSRWHISLSTWLRDYLYIPMGGNRTGRSKTIRNLMATMVLGGLWHGAAWNFVIWGCYHGVLLSAHRVKEYIWGGGRPASSGIWRWGKVVIFFCLTCYGWLIFRAPSMDTIIKLSKTLVSGFGNIALTATMPKFSAMLGLLILIPIEVAEYEGNGRPFYERMPVSIWSAVYAAMIFIFAMGLTNEGAQFVYFTF